MSGERQHTLPRAPQRAARPAAPVWRSARGLALGALSFAYLILLVNPVQALSALLYPISPAACRAVNRRCAQSVWGWWVWMIGYNGIAVRFTGEAPPPRENALLISNHQSIADVMVLMCFGDRCGRLPDMKWFVKHIVQYVPGPGWGMRFLDCIFVKRDWARDRRAIERIFSRYAAERIPVFVVSFLEGTRRTPEKARRAREFAASRGSPTPRHTLVPRTRGFVATVEGLREHLDAVYDVTVGYPDGVPSLVDCFACRVARVEVHVKRYPMGALPADSEALAQWAQDRFVEKDDLLDDLQRTQRFPGQSVMERP